MLDETTVSLEEEPLDSALDELVFVSALDDDMFCAVLEEYAIALLLEELACVMPLEECSVFSVSEDEIAAVSLEEGSSSELAEVESPQASNPKRPIPMNKC